RSEVCSSIQRRQPSISPCSRRVIRPTRRGEAEREPDEVAAESGNVHATSTKSEVEGSRFARCQACERQPLWPTRRTNVFAELDLSPQNRGRASQTATRTSWARSSRSGPRGA